MPPDFARKAKGKPSADGAVRYDAMGRPGTVVGQIASIASRKRLGKWHVGCR